MANAQTTISRPPRTTDPNAPTVIQAEEITGRIAREFNLDNQVEIVRDQTTITGDHGVFRQEENEVELTGNAYMKRFGDQFGADSLNLNLDTGEGTLLNTKYRMEASNAQGTAKRIDFEDENTTNIINGTYSTCEGPNPDWYLRSNTLHLDTARNIGTATLPVVYFQNVPILAAPRLTFPLSTERKSGVLAPIFGATSRGGMELAVPYYFNLAPNYDLTLYPKAIMRRGLQIGADARYLGTNYSGNTYIEVLPNDKEADRTRYAFHTVHKQDFTSGLSYGWNVKSASDDNYSTDFNSPIIVSSERLLSQSGGVNYSSKYWSASANVSKYQVLQDIDSPIIRPYDRLPQLTFNAARMDVNGFDLKFKSDATRFWLSQENLQGRERGDRFVTQAEVSYPFLTSGYFFTPKLSVNATKYSLDNSPYNKTSLTRVLPTASADFGLIFERPASLFGQATTQTFEPRLFYVYTPYRNQDQYPIFDAGEPGFGYAQLFTENRFAGYDRISDANNLTAAVTSRFIDPNGSERMRLTAGQRYYFRDQRVGLYNTTEPISENRSDLLLMANGRITPTISVDTALQYNQSTKRLYSANYTFQWKPGPKRVFNAEYRYLRNTTDANGNELDQINVSGQWPIAKRWYAVGQVSYSLPESKTIANLIGVEYNADCWTFRVVAQRFTTSTVDTNTAIFFQLQLNGLSNIGSNPLQPLRKAIPGYQQRPSDFTTAN